MIIKGVTYVSRQVSTMCLCQTGFPVHAVIRATDYTASVPASVELPNPLQRAFGATTPKACGTATRMMSMNRRSRAG